MNHKVILFCLLLPFLSAGESHAAGEDVLPEAVRVLMKKHRIQAGKIGIVVQRLDTHERLVAHRVDTSLNPASIIKIATAASALDLLGSTHRFETKFMSDGRVEDGVILGDLYVVGGGDPSMTVERFLLFLNKLRNRGIREIRGDLVIDDFFFDLPPHEPAAFDGAPLKPYNAGAGAFMVNFQTQRVVILPQGNIIQAYTEPPNDNFIVRNQIRSGKGRCRNWRGKIREVLRGDETRMTLTLKGVFPPRCGEQGFFIRALEKNAHAAGVFRAFWRRLGGKWLGQWRRGRAPATAQTLAVFESPPLSEVIASMNKYSNNVIARNLFLSLPAAHSSPPYSISEAHQTMSDWLAAVQVNGDGLVIDNGSGLSRKTRITAAQMAHLLRYIWRHPLRAELAASLPILGLDGTMRKRLKNKKITGEGRFKTGSLSGVKSIAGFFTRRRGARYTDCLHHQSKRRPHQGVSRRPVAVGAQKYLRKV